MAPTSTATAPPPRERRAASATLQHLYLAKMSSARNRAQSLTVKTAVGSCTSPKFDLPSSDSFQARLLFWRGHRSKDGISDRNRARASVRLSFRLIDRLGEQALRCLFPR